MSTGTIELKDVKNQRDYLIYNRDTIHQHSLAAQKLINLALNHIEEALEAGRHGKTVVWSGSPCPAILYACDAIPLYVTDLARLCNSETAIPLAENYFQMPPESCAMMREIIGGLYELKDSSCKKIITTGVCCEPELVGLYSMGNYGYDVYVMDIYPCPYAVSKERLNIVQDAYRKEFKEITEWISGKEINREKLQKEIIRANRIRRKVQELSKLGIKHNTYFGAVSQILLRGGIDIFYGQPEEFEAILDEMLEELRALPEGAYCEDRVQLMWRGGRGVDFSIFNAVDALGGYISDWNLSGKALYREDMDPLEACVEFATRGEGTISIENGCKEDERLFREIAAKGIILYSSLGCTNLTLENEMRRRYYSERNIPALVLTGTAELAEATGQTMTRLKAFLEMLS